MPYPDALSLETVGTGAGVLSAPLRNNFAEVQAEFNDLQAFFAGLGSAAEGQVAIWNGGGWTVGTFASDTRYRSTAPVDVVNTVTETALLSQEIAAGVLGTDKMLRCSLIGDYLNNSGAGRNLIVRVKFGATTVFSITFTFVENAARREFRLDLLLANAGAADSQRAGGTLTIHAAGGVPSTFVASGSIGAGSTAHIPIIGTAAEDTTAAKTLAVTVEHAVANANLSARKHYALVEIV